jgi:hypothetical protein
MTLTEHPVDRALPLWSDPLPPGDTALAAFRSVYADPLLVNGAETPLADLVGRARMMQGAFDGLHHTILERFEAPGRAAFAFRIAGRHVGPLTTPLGELAPTGLSLEIPGMDIFLITDGLVTGVWAMADYLSLLMQAAAVAMVQP